ncbi:MAG: glycosyltransferase family 39 protein [Flavobacteriales bacterium]|nr:glycosyltransferase family 39 protein [Flavobacteriales bacterium]
MSSVGNKWKDILTFKGDRPDSIVLYGALLLVITKLFLFPYTQTVDADAVSRTLISYKWSQDPYFITDSVWAPLYFYWNGLIIWLTGSIENGPRYVNVLLSGLTLLPFYFFVKNEFSRTGAIYSVAVFALSPIIFRNSFQALSGTPYLFFLALSLYAFSLALRRDQFKIFALAGFFLTIAAGFRYEAWIMIAVFTLIGILNKQYLGTLIFWGVGMIIPISWMLVGKIYHDDFLFGINGAYGWNIQQMDINANLNDTERLKRLFFYPMSWFLAVSPVLAWVLIVSFFRNILKKVYSRNQYYWMIPLLVIGVAFLVKAQDGTLLLQHRFTGSLVLLSSPLFALVIQMSTGKILRYLYASLCLLILPQSYFWYRVNLDEWTPLSRQIKSIIRDIQLSTGPETLPLPQIDNPLIIHALQVIDENWKEGNGLIIDFIGWSETYYLGMQYPESDPFIFPGAKNDQFPVEKYLSYIHDHPEGILVLHCASNYHEFVQYQGKTLQLLDGQGQIELNELYQDKGLRVFEYYKGDGWTIYLPGFKNDCAEIGSIGYFESRAYFSVQMREEAKRMIRKKGVSFEEAMLALAEREHKRFLNGEIEL